MLLVDADPAFRESLSNILRGEERDIQTAQDADAAYESAQRTAYDLVVAGPGRNGFDSLVLLDCLREIRPETRVIVTGEKDPGRIARAIRGQAYSYFHDPLHSSSLADMAALALEETSAWRDEIIVVSATPAWLTLDLRSRLEAAERATRFVREIAATLPVCEDVAVAYRELLFNAIEHGAKSDPRKRVRASLVVTASAVIGHIQDPGEGFSLDLIPHAAVSNPEDAPTRHVEIRCEQGQRPGGFGILMARNLVDELLYNQRGNASLFIKHLK